MHEFVVFQSELRNAKDTAGAGCLKSLVAGFVRGNSVHSLALSSPLRLSSRAAPKPVCS